MIWKSVLTSQAWGSVGQSPF